MRLRNARARNALSFTAKTQRLLLVRYSTPATDENAGTCDQRDLWWSDFRFGRKDTALLRRYSRVTRGRTPGLQSGAREATLFPTEVKPLHEITIALSLLESIESTAAEQGIERVNAVHVRVGALSGVVRDALLFSWDVATARTIAEGSQLVVEEVPLVVFCERCEAERSPHSGTGLLCPACGTPSPNILRGREMQLVSMEVPA
jgi:hydrogenase nickel incorporation protein HypA/HybF